MSKLAARGNNEVAPIREEDEEEEEEEDDSGDSDDETVKSSLPSIPVVKRQGKKE